MEFLLLCGSADVNDAKREDARSDEPAIVIMVLTWLWNCSAPEASFIASSCCRMASGLSPICCARAARTTLSGFSCTGLRASADGLCRGCSVACICDADCAAVPVTCAGRELILRTAAPLVLPAGVCLPLLTLFCVVLLSTAAPSASSSSDVLTALGGSMSNTSLQNKSYRQQMHAQP